MADIQHDFPIKAPIQRVYQAISTPQGLDAWWTQRSSGDAKEGSEFQLWFGPAYDWAMYLRILRRFLEHGEVVPYEARLEA
jgi:uncharacterized protein YndB with AHSA1/START domain